MNKFYNWIIIAVINMFQLAIIIVTLTDEARHYSFPTHFLKKHIGRCIPYGGKDVTVFQNGQVIGLYLAKKTMIDEIKYEESFSQTNLPPQSPDLKHI